MLATWSLAPSVPPLLCAVSTQSPSPPHPLSVCSTLPLHPCWLPPSCPAVKPKGGPQPKVHDLQPCTKGGDCANRPSPQAKEDQTPGDRAQVDKFPAAEPAACLRWMMPPSSVATPPGRGVCGGDRGVAGCWVRTCRCALLRAHFGGQRRVRVLLHHSAYSLRQGLLQELELS